MTETQPADGFWSVETELGTNGCMTVTADIMEIRDGCLVFTNKGMPGPGIAFAPGQWRAVFSSSDDGHPFYCRRRRVDTKWAEERGELWAVARRMRDEGATIRGIARELGVPKSTVHRWCAT